MGCGSLMFRPIVRGMTTTKGPSVSREAARREVRRAVDAGWARRAFAEKAKIDPGTLSDFLEGKRWAQATNRTKIEKALGWPAGKITDLAEATDVDSPAQRPVGLGLDDAAEGLPPEVVEPFRQALLAIKRPEGQ